MTHGDQVLELFGNANPVPDPDTFAATVGGPVPLTILDDGNEPMQGTEIQNTEPASRPARHRWLIAAAAVVIALVAVGAFVLASDRTDNAVATPTVVAADLTGMWRTPGGFYIGMSDDGTYRAMVEPLGEEVSDEFEWGTYAVTDSTLVFTVADDAVLFTECKERDANGDWMGIVGTYHVETIADDGQTWTTVLVDDACAVRARDYTGQFTKHAS
jgi:hypothetical protein